MTSNNPRKTAIEILYNILKNNAYLNVEMNNIRKSNNYSDLDIKFINEITHGVIKNKIFLDYVIKQNSKVKMNKISPYILCLLETGIYQIMFMDKIPQSAAVNECVKIIKNSSMSRTSGFVNAVLRSVIRNASAISFPDDTTQKLSVIFSYPEWIVKRWIENFGSDFTYELLIAFNEKADLILRTNKLKVTPDKLLDNLKLEGVVASKLKPAICPSLDSTIVCHNISGIDKLSSYNNGEFYVQDTAAVLTVEIMEPKDNETIIDMCAAPGGKSTHIAEKMHNKGKVYSFDIYEHKINTIKENAKRLDMNIIDAKLKDATVYDKEYFEIADRILVDAPCSGFGILRKKPDIKYQRKESDISELANLSLDILNNAALYLKKGGLLVFSTCTIEKQENEQNVQRFLDSHSNFKLEKITQINKNNSGYLTLYPNTDNTDGFFICKMRKQ